jgi:hypothetical protein
MVVHIVEPTLTIVPGNESVVYTLKVPTEAATGAGDEVLDFSGHFQALQGAGISMEVRDSAGNLLGAGERFRLHAPQGANLTLTVFGLPAPNGVLGSGAYTLDIDTLPQVVSIEAQALLPGATSNPGGPTTSLVVTLQGDRLDPPPAENPANYQVTWLGPDGLLGTADDQVLPAASVLYDPSTNIAVGSGTTYPTAVRQTVTLVFNQALPAGSYQIVLTPAIQTAPFNAGEAALLTPLAGFTGHPVVSLQGGAVSEGSQLSASNLVLPAGTLGSFDVWHNGTPFLSQLHDDLGALLDAQLTASGDSSGITSSLLQQIKERVEPALGAPGQRPTGVLVLVLDPVSANLTNSSGDQIDYNVGDGSLNNTFASGFVNVIGNIEVIVLNLLGGQLSLQVSDVPATARGGVVFVGEQTDMEESLTDALRAGTTDFSFSF